MLHDGQQFDVCEPEACHVGDQTVGGFLVREEPVAILRHVRPRRQVHLVDRHRPLEPHADFVCPSQPVIVRPAIVAGIPGHRGQTRRRLEHPTVRVGLDQEATLARTNLELVARARLDSGNEGLPDAGPDTPHRMSTAIPRVEVGDDTDALGVRGPDGEMKAGRTLMSRRPGAKPLVRLVVFALLEALELGVDRRVFGHSQGRSYQADAAVCTWKPTDGRYSLRSSSE